MTTIQIDTTAAALFLNIKPSTLHRRSCNRYKHLKSIRYGYTAYYYLADLEKVYKYDSDRLQAYNRLREYNPSIFYTNKNNRVTRGSYSDATIFQLSETQPG